MSAAGEQVTEARDGGGTAQPSRAVPEVSVERAWDALVGTALLGTSRKPLDVTRLPPPIAAATPAAETDPAARLLDVAALLAVYRRAGATAASSGPRPSDDARPDGNPESVTSEEPGEGSRSAGSSAPTPRHPAPAAAARRLGDLLANAQSGGHGLLLVWLRAAAAGGFEAPSEHLPALLDLAVASRTLAPDVLPVLGGRGRWLAGHRRDWRTATTVATQPVPSGDSRDPVWTHGTPAERRAWFTALRHDHPDTARSLLLELDWPAQDGPTRLALTSALGTHLSDADEELLERSRHDRRQDVRFAALDLLARLPSSGYVAELIELAPGCLRVERVMLRRTLIVTLPELPPGSAGFPVPPRLQRSSAGPATTLLWYLLSVVPLGTWQQRLDLDARQLTGLPVADDLGPIVHGGWQDAALAQRNAQWAAALMRVTRTAGEVVGLLPVLAPEPREKVAVGALAKDPGGQLTAALVEAMLGAVARPWSRELAAAVIGWLSRYSAISGVPGAAGLLTSLSQQLPDDPAVEAAMRTLAHRQPPHASWYRALSQLADVLLASRQIHEELR